ncbi:MAG: type IV secretory system conjugative DNA transfer family protein, partial [Gemmatimonadota bacterium]|nr:type IV secretory system conjugative DNA transfer family protein [Gemmatimonadota bacterium]
KWETFAANVQVLQAFGVNDLFTANHLSARLGDATILVESENVSAGISLGRNRARQESAAQTTAEKGRRLLTPDEVLRLPHEQQLLFVRGESPVRAQKLDYLRDAEFAGLSAENPMYVPAAGPDAATLRAAITS